MSWQATEWAIRQRTGAARRKLLLLTLADYADRHGVCWPSQETLARDTEQSVDSVQRQLAALERLKLVERTLMPKRGGQWRGHLYVLALQAGRVGSEQRVVRSRELRPDQAAGSTSAGPQSLRYKPSIEPLSEPSRKNTTESSAERLLVFRGKQEGDEVVQNRIASRIGRGGWLVMGDLTDAQRSRLTTLERQGRLDDETLAAAVLVARGGRS